MDPGGDGPPLDLDGADSDGARIAQATGLFMERFGLDAPQALALLQVVLSKSCISTHEEDAMETG